MATALHLIGGEALPFCSNCSMQHSKIGVRREPGRLAPSQFQGELVFHPHEGGGPLHVEASVCTGCGTIHLSVNQRLFKPPKDGELRLGLEEDEDEV